MREYLLTLFIAAGMTYLLLGLVGRLAYRVGAVPDVRDRDVHASPVPRLGGVAMLAGVLAAFVVASELPRLRIVFEQYDDARALLTAAVVVTLVGVADDIWDLDALTKFAGQVLAAGLLTVQGVQFTWLWLPGGILSLGQAQGVVLTVIFVVTVINAVNFVDGLDGLAAGMVGIGAAAFFIYAYVMTLDTSTRMTTAALTTVVLTGVCLGFLPHNVNPARIFMGDSGSMLIGLLLAAGSVSLTGQFFSGDLEGERSSLFPALLPLILPLVVMAVPFIDLLLAVGRRTRAGRSPFAPDKKHLHHRLLEIGHSQKQAVLIMWVWSAVVAFGLVALALLGGWVTAAVFIGFGLLAVVFTAWRRTRALGTPA